MSQSNRNHGLDLLRCFAIIPVLLLHAMEVIHEIPESLKSVFSFGWSGVDLFFVLSGFLIGRQVFTESDSIGLRRQLQSFWVKRWFRTLPLYFFVLFIYVVIKPLIGFPFKEWNFSFLIFTQNYFNPKDFVQTWSLCVEEQFYLFFPLLAFALNLRSRNMAIWLIPLVISFLCRAWFWWDGSLDGASLQFLTYEIRFPTHTRMDGISLGVFLAASFNYWHNWGKVKKNLFRIRWVHSAKPGILHFPNRSQNNGCVYLPSFIIGIWMSPDCLIQCKIQQYYLCPYV